METAVLATILQAPSQASQETDEPSFTAVPGLTFPLHWEITNLYLCPNNRMEEVKGICDMNKPNSSNPVLSFETAFLVGLSFQGHLHHTRSLAMSDKGK